MNTSFEPKSQAPTQRAPHQESQSAKVLPSRTIVHAKLEMTEPGDHDEQEADAIANSVMSGRKIARKISSGNSGSSGIAVSSQMESQLNHLQGGGQAMPEGLRSMMENGFGQDFGQVRLHTDSEAASMSSSIHAKAFTHGNDIYFNRGQFAPETAEGQCLVAHELTHVVQGTGKVGRQYFDNTECNKECESSDYACIYNELNKGCNPPCKVDDTTCSNASEKIQELLTLTFEVSQELQSIYNEIGLENVDNEAKNAAAWAAIGSGVASGVVAGLATGPGVIACGVIGAVLGIIGGIITLASGPSATTIGDTKDEHKDYYGKLINDLKSYNEEDISKMIDSLRDLKKRLTTKKTREEFKNKMIEVIKKAYHIKEEGFKEDGFTDGKILGSVNGTLYYLEVDEDDFEYEVKEVVGDVKDYGFLIDYANEKAREDNSKMAYYQELLPVLKPSLSFNSKSNLYEFKEYITDQSEIWHEDLTRYVLVPRELLFSKEDAIAIARSFKHKSSFSSPCTPQNVADDYKRSFYSAYESEQKVNIAYREYIEANTIDFCGNTVKSLSLNYDFDDMLGANKAYFELVGSNLFSSKQIAFLKYVFDQLDIDY